METLLSYRYSFLAGAFAAGGSFFGKLPSFLSARQLLAFQSSHEVSNSTGYYYLELALLRLLPLLLMLFCNILNLRYFLKALQMTQQTLTATVLTAASNYFLSFILGVVIYQEPLTIWSSLGITCMLAGLWILCDDSTTIQVEKKKQL